MYNYPINVCYNVNYDETPIWKDIINQPRDPRISLRDFNTFLGKGRLTGLIDLVLSIVDLNLDSIVEIGSFIGESTEVFAKKFKNVYAVDPWIGTWFTGDPMSYIEQLFDERIKDISNITKMKMTSEEACKLFENNSLSMIYIDSIHEYDVVMKDVAIWRSKVKDNGYIAGHDYNINDFPGVVKAVNELCRYNAPDYVFADTSWLCKKSSLNL